MDAPVVIAKGADLMAKRIRELAREHNVPIMENPPLARTLYDQVEIDQAIPPNLYAAVAQVIAFVYKLKTEDHRLMASAPTATATGRKAVSSSGWVTPRPFGRRRIGDARHPDDRADPAWLLDILLTINIGTALLIIGTALYTENALSF